MSQRGCGVQVDIWALGITAMEMAETIPPRWTVHPMRVIFLISREEPPRLSEWEKWTLTFHDFVRLCLTKVRLSPCSTKNNDRASHHTRKGIKLRLGCCTVGAGPRPRTMSSAICYSSQLNEVWSAHTSVLHASLRCAATAGVVFPS